ncbi:MAG: oxidoreductase [Gemmatimonadota bacterium]
MTAAAAAALIALALLDGAFAGFRSSVGRTGLISHRAADRLAARRGASLVCLLLAPVTALVSADVTVHPARTAVYTRAGEAMLAVYGPYAAVVLAALGCYAVLGWRQRYLASAVILGPLTLLRPAVAVAGAVLAAVATHDGGAAVCAVLAVVAVLAVEPAADRRWYTPRPGR